MRQAFSRNTDPSTSHDAAEQVTAKIPRLEKQVLDCLEQNRKFVGSGLTSKEIAISLGLEHVTISPRLRPLANRNMVRDTGKRRDKSIVWEVM